MSGRMPILSQNDVFETPRDPMNRFYDPGAIGNSQPAARAEIVLYVDDEQNVLTGDRHTDYIRMWRRHIGFGPGFPSFDMLES